MAHIFAKKIFEPFLVELRSYSNQLRPRKERQKRKNRPPITIFEPKENTPSITKFGASDTNLMKQASPVDTSCCLKSFPKSAFTPLARFPGYPASTVKPGVYFPSNWRWYADRKDPERPMIKDVRGLKSTTGEQMRSLKLRNLARIEDLKRQLRDESMLRGSKPKK